MSPVIAVSNLGKRYGRTVAVDDVSLEVFEGEIFGLIGPNGAGKTTTMEYVQGKRQSFNTDGSDLGGCTRIAPWGDTAPHTTAGTFLFTAARDASVAARCSDK